MKTTSILAVAATLTSSVVSAQGLVLPPSCAIDCITQLAPSSGCTADLTNYACFCKSSTFASTFNTCITSGCSASDLESTKSAVITLCQSAGVTINFPSTASGSTVPAGSSSTRAPSSSSTTGTNPNAADKPGAALGLLGTTLALGVALLWN
ncbi:hypothetical protein H072_2330 [Dactylellina haptotyla CBS 200.50]|uniref:CFEM domain-containing protein n=1 Tax=Dactylellina haptotyla (strain CBS 200.50) TaxID=1284197 RepID=S8AL03_DACHA|nr:hypothetical protein H072_2330 [Dactylellina haptotyla CBS 200.50]